MTATKIAKMLGVAWMAVATVACGGAGGAESDDGATDAEELKSARVVLAIEDDGDVHATGLRGKPGPAWDRFVRKGDHVILVNRSAKDVSVEVRSTSNFTDDRVHKALPTPTTLHDGPLVAHDGAIAWTVESAARGYSIRVDNHDGTIVSEPDGNRLFPVLFDVR